MDRNSKLHIVKLISKKDVILIGISVLFYIATVFLSGIYAGNFGSSYSQRKLQNQTNDIEESMDVAAQQYSDYLQLASIKNANQKISFLPSEILQPLEEQGIHLFIYQNDSCIAWSDNDFLIETPIYKNAFYVHESDIGLFLVKDVKIKEYSIRFAFRVYQHFNINNEYLKSRLNNNFGIKRATVLSRNKEEGNPVLSKNGDYLFSSIWKESNDISTIQFGIIFSLFIFSLLFFMTAIQQFVRKLNQNAIFILLLSGLLYSLIIAVFKTLLIPNILANSEIFSSLTFASSGLINSLGTLLIMNIWVLFLTSATAYYLKNIVAFASKNGAKTHALHFMFLMLLVILLYVLKVIVSDLVFNSTVSFNLEQVSEISSLTIIGLISLLIGVSVFILILNNGSNLFVNISRKFAIINLIIVEIGIFAFSYFTNDADYSIPIFFAAISLVSIFLFRKNVGIGKSTINTINLILFSLLIAYWFNILNIDNEHIKRKYIIQDLAINQDPQTEYLFTKISKQVYKDNYLLDVLQTDAFNYDSLAKYVENKYFKSKQHFQKYDFQTTICSSNLKLLIRPQNVEIDCDTFFYRNLIAFGKLTDNKNLYRLEYGSGQINYLGVFRFYSQTENGYRVFTMYMEINSKLKRKGFTRVLSAKEYDPFAKIANYSLARYEKLRRVEKYGRYTFPEHFSWQVDSSNAMTYYQRKGFDHLIYRLDNDLIYVLSKELSPSVGSMAPFSYVFILFGLVFVLLQFFQKPDLIKTSINIGFGFRLQVAMISVILISFAVITAITVFYIQELDANKNRNQLEKLAISLQTEFEHKLSSESSLDNVDIDYLNSLLIKFSKVFDTDINIYKLDGKLLASTRYEVFNNMLMSKYMNSKAFNILNNEHQSLFVTTENIGDFEFSSAYMPFHNGNDEIIAFMNLPYFARQETLRTEISSILMTLMNVYTFIIVLSILLILIVSKYISRPLTMLKSRLQAVGMGKENKKIEWSGIEEIQALVVEYNRMIDALELSSEKLAKSERESAWREMAKQVAHEIKNPLTPMKLSVQYMMHSYDENDENQKEKLTSLTNTLIQQIDTLSDIATAFSDFANMPKSSIGNHDLVNIINSVIEIYKDYSNVEFAINVPKEVLVNIDKNQWIRVFNNLIKNSIQAKKNDEDLLIEISVMTKNNQIEIIFKDNGEGMPEDMKERIFVPNFTTKTKGAGLGLAMVKNIIENSGGSISFESELGIGTSFVILL